MSLELAGIPTLAAERNDAHPLVIAGGTCTYNPEPMADFSDLLVIGEGEEVVLELAQAVRSWKAEGGRDRSALLRALARIEGIYVPSLYRVSHTPEGKLAGIEPQEPGLPFPILKRVVRPLPPPPTRPVVPYLPIIHDVSEP